MEVGTHGESGGKDRYVSFARIGFPKAWIERKNRITSERVEPFSMAERLEAISQATRSRAGTAWKSAMGPKRTYPSFPSEVERAAPSLEYKRLIGKPASEPVEKLTEHEEEEEQKPSRRGQTKPGRIRQPVYTSLVSKALSEHEEVPGLEIPQWIVEMWQESTDLARAVRRLGLPESTVKTKLPYYREAMVDWQHAVVPADNLARVVQQYHKAGHHGHFDVPPSSFDRSRGKRFEMPRLDMKAIAFANFLAFWQLARASM